jgi:hypothetical protein
MIQQSRANQRNFLLKTQVTYASGDIKLSNDIYIVIYHEIFKLNVLRIHKQVYINLP